MSTAPPNTPPSARLPKPWKVDEYLTPDGRQVAMARAHDGRTIIQPTEDVEFVRAVVASANDGCDLDAIASIQSRWQAALDAAHEDTARVRDHFSKEASVAIKEVYRLQDEVERLSRGRPEARAAPKDSPASKPAVATIPLPLFDDDPEDQAQ